MTPSLSHRSHLFAKIFLSACDSAIFTIFSSLKVLLGIHHSTSEASSFTSPSAAIRKQLSTTGLQPIWIIVYAPLQRRSCALCSTHRVIQADASNVTLAALDRQVATIATKSSAQGRAAAPARERSRNSVGIGSRPPGSWFSSRSGMPPQHGLFGGRRHLVSRAVEPRRKLRGHQTRRPDSAISVAGVWF